MESSMILGWNYELPLANKQCLVNVNYYYFYFEHLKYPIMPLSAHCGVFVPLLHWVWDPQLKVLALILQDYLFLLMMTKGKSLNPENEIKPATFSIILYDEQKFSCLYIFS